MPRPMIWDLDTPTSNVALERIRLALLAGDDVWAVLDALLGMFDDAAAERALLRTDLEQTRTELAALTDRVTALEPAPEPPAPTPEEPLP